MVQPDLIIIEQAGNKHAKVQDKYGICKVQMHSLLKGSKPTISTAIDKTEYFRCKLQKIQNDLIVIGQYKGL